MSFQQQQKQQIAQYPFQTKVTTLITNGKEAQNHKLLSPSDIVYSPKRKLFALANLGNNTIMFIDQLSLQVKSIFGIAYNQHEQSPSVKHIDGFQSDCLFKQPHGLALSTDENYLFVADTYHHAIRVIDIDNLICSTIVGTHKKKGGYIQIGPLNQTLLEEPRGICVDQKGNIYVTTKQAVVYIDLENQQSIIIAGDVTKFGFKDGYSRQALFDHPDGIICFENHLFVADTYNHRIRMIDLESQKVITICGSEQPGYIDGDFSKTKFNFPQKLAISPNQQLIYLTELNDCIRVIDLKKNQVFTLCGGFNSKNGLQDGDSKEALFNFPYGIVIPDNNTDNLIITESDNHSLRMITIIPEQLKSIDQEKIKSQKEENNQIKDECLNIEQYQKPQTQVQKQVKFSQSTQSMLISVAQASASAVNDTVFDVVLSYQKSGDQNIIDLLNMLGKCLALILGIKNLNEGQELIIFKRQDIVIDEIVLNEAYTLSFDDACFLKSLIDRLQKFNEWKLPGIRTLFQWFVDFEKALSYKYKSQLESQKVTEIEPLQREQETKTNQQQPKIEKQPQIEIQCKNEEIFDHKQAEQSVKSSRKHDKKQENKVDLKQVNTKNSAKVKSKNPSPIRKLDQNRVLSPKNRKEKSNNDIILENKNLKQENQKLKAQIQKMKKDFLELSTAMESIIHDKTDINIK